MATDCAPRRQSLALSQEASAGIQRIWMRDTGTDLDDLATAKVQ